MIWSVMFGQDAGGMAGTKDGVIDGTMMAGGSVGGAFVAGRKALVTARQANVARRSVVAGRRI
jgi:hypothetical protein